MNEQMNEYRFRELQIFVPRALYSRFEARHTKLANAEGNKTKLTGPEFALLLIELALAVLDKEEKEREEEAAARKQLEVPNGAH